MASDPSSSTEARGVLDQLRSAGLQGLAELARNAGSLADEMNRTLGRLQEILDTPPPVVETKPPEPAAPPSLGLPFVLDFAARCRGLESRPELPALLASSAARLAPRVLLFARRGADLIAWDGYVDGQSAVSQLRGAHLTLADLPDLADTLDEGSAFAYAGFLEPFYRQLPAPFAQEPVGASYFLPLQVAEHCVGVLCADAPGSADHIEEPALELMTRHAALVMELELRKPPPVAETASSEAPAPEAPLEAKSDDRAVVQSQEAVPESALDEPAPAPREMEEELADDSDAELQFAELSAAEVDEPPFDLESLDVEPASDDDFELGTLDVDSSDVGSEVEEPEFELGPLEVEIVDRAPPVRDFGKIAVAKVIMLPSELPSSAPGPAEPEPPKDEESDSLETETGEEVDSESSEPATEDSGLEPFDVGEQSGSTTDASVAQETRPLPAYTQAQPASYQDAGVDEEPVFDTPAPGGSPSDGELIWDIDAGSETSDVEPTRFHIDNPDSGAEIEQFLDEGGSSDDATDEERAARKLARVIIRDVVVYNSGRIEQGIAAGNVGDPLSEDILRGAIHYRSKVSPELYPRRFLWEAVVDLIAGGRADLLGELNLDC